MLLFLDASRIAEELDKDLAANRLLVNLTEYGHSLVGAARTRPRGNLEMAQVRGPRLAVWRGAATDDSGWTRTFSVVHPADF